VKLAQQNIFMTGCICKNNNFEKVFSILGLFRFLIYNSHLLSSSHRYENFDSKSACGPLDQFERCGKKFGAIKNPLVSVLLFVSARLL
jgi:hypothetical protein